MRRVVTVRNRERSGARVAGTGTLQLVESPPPPVGHEVELQVRAHSMWLSAVRTLAGDLAARADFDVDAVADLRLAVDEACAELIRFALPGSTLTCRFALVGDRITVTAWVPVGEAATLDTRSFGWRVLCALADDVEVLTGTAGPGGDAPALGLRLDARRRVGAAR